MKKSQMNLKENIKHWKKNIASIMIRDIYRALNATKTKLANIRRALEKEKEMTDFLKFMDELSNGLRNER